MSDTIIYVLPHLGAIPLRGLLRSAKIATYLGARVFLINFLISERVASNGSVTSFAANYQTFPSQNIFMQILPTLFSNTFTHLPRSCVTDCLSIALSVSSEFSTTSFSR